MTGLIAPHREFPAYRRNFWLQKGRASCDRSLSWDKESLVFAENLEVFSIAWSVAMKRRHAAGEGMLEPAIMAVVLVVSVLAGLFYMAGSDTRWRDESLRAEAQEAPRPALRAQPSAPAVMRSNAPAMSAYRSQPRGFSATGSRDEQRARLAALEKTCRYWTEQNTQGQHWGLQASACGDMQRYAASIGRSTQVMIRKPGAPHAQRHQSTPGVSVVIRNCEPFGYGSIRYRRCRAAEKKRLHGKCLSLQEQMNRVRGAEYRRLKPWREAYCVADARYVVVK
ncbi:hypothetical protein [Salinisphaera dokdonensis]|uniref:hypothetical protein n=1 Tax=Salinisphaera dokdonensis TaxID=454598 RepID=UPI00333E5266